MFGYPPNIPAPGMQIWLSHLCWMWGLSWLPYFLYSSYSPSLFWYFFTIHIETLSFKVQYIFSLPFQPSFPESFIQEAPQIPLWLIRIEIQILFASALLKHATSATVSFTIPRPLSKGNITCLVIFYIYIFLHCSVSKAHICQWDGYLLDLKSQEGKDCALNKFRGA